MLSRQKTLFRFFHFGPLVDAQDIFNDQEVNIIMRADQLHITFSKPVDIDPGDPSVRFVLETLFSTGQQFLLDRVRVIIEDENGNLGRIFTLRYDRRVDG